MPDSIANTSYAATAQHLQLIHKKRKKLEEAQRETMGQYVTAVARAFKLNEIKVTDLREAYDYLKSFSVPGFQQAWKGASLPGPQKIEQMIIAESRREPWLGRYPMDPEDDRPPRGQMSSTCSLMKILILVMSAPLKIFLTE